MRADDYHKLTRRHPAELARQLQLDMAACALLAADQTVAEFVMCLALDKQFPAALAMLAHALPKREAVWWGCIAVRRANPPDPNSAADTALSAAEAWVYHPDEQSRQPIGEAATKAGLNTPAGWAAMAAFWSGGSLAPPDSPVVPPQDDLTAKAVAGATTLAAIDDDQQRAAGKSIAFIKIALDIALGGDGRNVPV